MAEIFRFPRPYREPPQPPLAVRVVASTEYFVIAGDMSWLHGDLRSALRDAIELADELDVPIQIDRAAVLERHPGIFDDEGEQ